MVSHRSLYLKLLAWFVAGIAIGYLFPPPGSATLVSEADQLAAEVCEKELNEIGRKTFAKRYGEKKAIRSCVARKRGRANRALQASVGSCQGELAALGPDAFTAFHGYYDFTLEEANEQCTEEAAYAALGIPYDDEDDDEEPGDEA